MILLHADDYGIHPKQAERILSCHTNGCLNSVSALPNSRHLQECMEQLDGTVLCGIHLNFAEGPCCAEKENLSLLTDREGRFRLSFGNMLLLSILHYKKLRKQIKEECTAQIQKLAPYLKNGIRIDSHRHYHMIPAVFSGICDACREQKLTVAYVRWPAEPLSPYLMHREVWAEIPFQNLMKNICIHILAVINYPALKKAGWKNKTAVFFGMLLTDRMFYEPVKCLLPDFIKYAEQKNKDLEILFHPGGVHPDEGYLDEKYQPFYMEKNRQMEAETLQSLIIKREDRRV